MVRGLTPDAGCPRGPRAAVGGLASSPAFQRLRGRPSLRQAHCARAARYKEVPPDWKTAQPSDQIARGKWWEIFQDPQLNALEEQVNVSNENLKAAEARFRQARALVRFNRAAYYPTVTAGASARTRASVLTSPAGPSVHARLTEPTW